MLRGFPRLSHIVVFVITVIALLFFNQKYSVAEVGELKLVSPTNGATIQPQTQIDFKWNEYDAGNQVLYYYFFLEKGGNSVIGDPKVNQIGKKPAEFEWTPEEEGEYSWHVVVSKYRRWSTPIAKSEIWRFVVTKKATVFLLLSPEYSSTPQSSVTFKWTKADGAASYNLYVDSLPAKNIKLSDLKTTSENGVQVYSYSMDVTDWSTGEHTWNLKAVMANGSEVQPNNHNSKKWGFFTEKKPVAAPILKYPAKNAEFVSGNLIEFTWNAEGSPTSIEFYVNGTKVADVPGNSPSYKHKTSQAGQYSWKVRAVYDGNTSAFSEERTFIVLPLLGAFELVAPKDKEVVEGSVTFAWTVAENVSSFIFELDGKKTNLPITKVQLTYIAGKRVHSYTQANVSFGTHRWSVTAYAKGPQESGATNAKVAWTFSRIEKLIPPTNLKEISGKTRFISGSKLTFSWDAATGAKSYEVTINDKVMGSVNTPSYSWTPRQAGSYGIKVTAVSGSIKRISAEFTFTVVAALTRFNLVSPVKGENVGDSFELKWEASQNATGYDIILNGRVFDKNITPQASQKIISVKLKRSDVNEGKNTWTIRALGELDQLLEPQNKTDGFFMLVEKVLPPTPFKAITPINKQVIEDSVTLKWEESKNTVGYRITINGIVVEASRNISAQKGVCSYSVDSSRVKVGENNWLVEALSVKGEYVKISNAHLATFVFAQTPGAFALISPINGAVVKDTVVLKWRFSRGSQSYEISLNGRVIEQKFEATPQNGVCSYTVKGIAEPGKYTWTVSAIGSNAKKYSAENKGQGSFSFLVAPGDFALFAPLNKAKVEGDVVLKWNASMYAQSYRISLNGEYIEQHFVPSEQGAICSYTISASTLQAGTFTWGVEAVGFEDLTTQARNNVQGSFKYVVTPSGFVLVSPIDNQRITGSIELRWKVAQNAVSYRIVLDGRNIETACKPVVQNSFCTYKLTTVSEGSHKWEIHAKSATNIEVSATNNAQGTFTYQILPGSFNLISPIKGEKIKGIVTLKWSASPNCSGYRISLDDKEVSSRFNPPANNGVCELTFKGNEVAPGAHTWQIYAIKGAEAIPATNNAEGSFEFIVAPGPFALVAPINGSNVESKIEFKWRASQNAELYILHLDGKIVTNVFKPTEESSECSFTLDSSDLKPGKHTWFVKAANEWGELEPSNVSQGFFNLVLPPQPFRLTYPINGAIVSGAVELKWSVSQNATHYSVYFNNKLLTDQFKLETDEELCKYPLTNQKLAVGEHFWKVVAHNSSTSEVEASNSKEGRFTFKVQPGAFSLVTPLDGVVVQGDVDLKWNESENATGYSVILDGTEIESNVNPNAVNGVFSYRVPKDRLTPGTHTWKIVALSGTERIHATNNSSGKFEFSVVPSSFLLVSPIDNEVIEGECIFKWKVAQNASSYSISLNGTILVADHNAVPINRTCSYKILESQLKEGQNNWSVTAIGRNGEKIPASNGASGTFLYSYVPALFKLISPIDGETVKDIAILRWSRAEHATEYKVTLNGKPWKELKSGQFSGSTCSVEIPVDQLTEGYNRWMVFSKSAKGTEFSPTNEESGFFKFLLSPASFKLISPIDGKECSTEVMLKWSHSQNTTLYRIVIDEKVVENGFVGFPQGGVCSYKVNGLSPGSHTWNVMAVGKENILINPENKAQGRFVCVLPLGDFTVISPVNNASVEEPICLKWNRCQNAESYTILVDSKELISGINPTPSAGICTYTLDASRISEGEHSWTVYAVAKGQEKGALNNSRASFKYFKKLGRFELIAPINEAAISQVVELTWKTCTNAVSYKVLLDGKEISGRQSIAGEIVKFNPSVLIPFGSHTWSVIALGAGNNNLEASNKSQGRFILEEKVVAVTRTPEPKVDRFPLSPFFLNSPVNSQEITGEVKLTWHSSVNAAEYEVFVNDILVFSGAPKEFTAEDGTKLCSIALEGSSYVTGKNKWFVTAISRDSTRMEASNNRSGAFVYVTEIAAQPFSLLFPLNNEVVKAPATLVWERANSSMSYALYVDGKQVKIPSHRIVLSTAPDGIEICSVQLDLSYGKHTWKVLDSEGNSAINESEASFKVKLFTPMVIAFTSGFAVVLCLFLIMFFVLKSSGNFRSKMPVKRVQDAPLNGDAAEIKTAMSRELQAVMKHINTRLDNIESNMKEMSGDPNAQMGEGVTNNIKQFREEFASIQRELDDLKKKVSNLSQRRG